jgi:hypothetical protein
MSATWHLVQEERDKTRDTTKPGNTSEHKYIRESNVTQIPLYQQECERRARVPGADTALRCEWDRAGHPLESACCDEALVQPQRAQAEAQALEHGDGQLESQSAGERGAASRAQECEQRDAAACAALAVQARDAVQSLQSWMTKTTRNQQSCPQHVLGPI